jgi:DNA-binding NarL/FixJ family response regulator
MPRFLIADDHPLFREALVSALVPYFPTLIVTEVGSIDEMQQALNTENRYDLVLLDLTMPGGEWFNGLTYLVESHPDVPVAVVSASDDIEIISQAMTLGASAFIPKSTPTQMIASAITKVIKGETWLPEELKEQIDAVSAGLTNILLGFKELTPKQLEVLRCVREGMMNKQIAHEMNVTEATIKAHISAALKKLGINTRTQAVLLMDKLKIS